jgi:peptidoglycan/LPS O-acetylase OafA/YrhL
MAYGVSYASENRVRSPNIRYLVGLDHLRALAALLIVFYHGLHVLSFFPQAQGGDPYRFWIHTRNPLLALLEEGHTAVALFMVLSGFVFSVSATGQEIAYGAFMRNRFLRIYPLLIFVLFVGAIAFPAQYTFIGFAQTLLFQADFQGALQGGPFPMMCWAVAVEFQFYLLFPFLHHFLERHGTRWALACIALCLTMRWMAVMAGGSNARDISYWHILGRLDQFLIGMLAARLFLRVRNKRIPWGWLSLGSLLIVLGVIMQFNLLGGYPTTQLWKIVWPPIEGLAWALLLVTYTAFADRVPALISRPMAALGTISYSIYMLHYACLSIIPRVWNPRLATNPNVHSQLYVVAMLPLLIPLAALSYYVIERPFLALRVRYLRRAPEA